MRAIYDAACVLLASPEGEEVKTMVAKILAKIKKISNKIKYPHYIIYDGSNAEAVAEDDLCLFEVVK